MPTKTAPSNAFNYDIRVLMCHHCGAPIPTGALSGGVVSCDYCGVAHQVASRKMHPVDPQSVSSTIPEQDRLDILRRQDGRSIEIPASLQPLLDNGEIAVWKLQEASALWQSTREQLRFSDDYQAAENLFFLSVMLSNHHVKANEPLRSRALYESALEVMTMPRHRQHLYASLARSAARDGDLAAAEKWLAPCDAFSMDLEVDSEYRTAQATIDTAKGDWAAVLRTLGEDIDSVPIASTLDGVGLVLRANALEHTGNESEAASQLALFMAANEELGRVALTRIIEGFGNRGITVCQSSFAASQAIISEVAADQAVHVAAGGGIGGPFTLVGGLLVVGGIVAMVVAGPNAGAVIPMIIGAIFFSTGFGFVRQSSKVKRLHQHGLSATGRVLGIEPTNTTVNGVRMMKLAIEVAHPNLPAYQVTVDVLNDEYTPGMNVRLKVDPNNPNFISLD